MAVALVVHTAAASSSPTSGVTSSAVDTTTATLLTVVVASYAVNAEPTLSDSKGNTWTGRTVQSDSLGRVRIFDCANPAVGSGHTFSLSAGVATYAALAASAWSGVTTSSPFDQQNGASDGTNTATTLATGSVTPSQDNELVFSGWELALPGQPASASVSGGFTILDTLVNVAATSFGVAAAYLIQTSAAAANPALSWTVASNASAAVATYKVATAAGRLSRPASLEGLGGAGQQAFNPSLAGM